MIRGSLRYIYQEYTGQKWLGHCRSIFDTAPTRRVFCSQTGTDLSNARLYFNRVSTSVYTVLDTAYLPNQWKAIDQGDMYSTPHKRHAVDIIDCRCSNSKSSLTRVTRWNYYRKGNGVVR